jgi:hypothetical protein
MTLETRLSERHAGLYYFSNFREQAVNYLFGAAILRDASYFAKQGESRAHPPTPKTTVKLLIRNGN